MNYNKTHVDYDHLPEWISFLRKDLDLKSIGIGLIHLSSGKGYKFLHRHVEQEEIYFILKGKGLMHIDGEDILITRGDILRISPEGKRALKADNNSDLVAICVGGLPVEKYPQYEKSSTLIDDGIPDFDEPPYWYKDNEEIRLYLQNLKKKRKERNTDLSKDKK